MSMGSGGVFGQAPFNPLALLLGQQAGTAAADDFIDPMTGENTMVVRGDNRRPPMASPPVYNDAPTREAIDPRYVLNDDRIAPTEEEMSERLPRKGMFGVKGTLRDVLGILGDAFLVQGGGKAVYQPQRQQERMGDAMFGGAENPLQAAERLAAAGFPEEAQKVIEAHQKNQYQQGVLKSQDDARKDVAKDRQYENVLKARNQVARWLQAADTPAKQGFVLAQAQRLADELQVPISTLGIDDNELTEDERAILASGDMTVNQQQQLPLARERVAIQRDTYEAKKDGRMFDRPPPRPGPQPRSQTELEYFQEIDRIPPGKRTQGQKDFYNKYTKGTGRRRGGSTPPPPGGKGKYTVTRIK